MATTGAEPVGSMGNDTPLAVLSDQNPLLFSYFQQLFAQVSNPPLDAIREELVTSLETFIGPEQNLFEETPEHCASSSSRKPFLTNRELAKIRELDVNGLRSQTLSTLFDVEAGRGALARGARAPLRRGVARRRRGLRVHHPLRPRRRRDARADPVPARDVGRAPPPDPRGHAHQGRPRRRVGRAARGAPLRAADRLRRRRRQPVPRARDAERHLPPPDDAAAGRLQDGGEELHQGAAQGRAQGHVEDGHLDAAELPRRPDLRGRRPQRRSSSTRYFTWTPSRIGGIGIDEIETETRARHHPRLSRSAGAGEPSTSSPAATTSGAATASTTCTTRTRSRCCSRRRARGNFKTFQEFTDLIDHESRRLCTIRGLLEFKPGNADPDRRGRAGEGDRQALRHRRRVARLDQPRGARDAGDRDEPHRRPQQHGRGRRGLPPLHARRQRRLAQQRDQAGRLRPLRRDEQLPRPRDRPADQDGAGLQARRGRPAARPQGRRLHRLGAPHDARRRADLAAAAPRHLLDRGPGAADPRPQELATRPRASTSSSSPSSASARSPRASPRATATSS